MSCICCGETFWSNKIRVVIGDPINPGEVLAWYGGMGSCNDLLIAEVNGHKVRMEDHVGINDRLDSLRRQVDELARALRA